MICGMIIMYFQKSEIKYSWSFEKLNMREKYGNFKEGSSKISN